MSNEGDQHGHGGGESLGFHVLFCFVLFCLGLGKVKEKVEGVSGVDVYMCVGGEK